MRRTSPADKQLYADFLSVFDFCWGCGRGATDVPLDWWSAWGVDRAHIVSHPRMELRQVIAALCKLCHDNSHRKRIVTRSRPADWPVLERPHLLWLKERFDPEYFDLKVLQKCAIGRLPEPSAPPDCYLNEFRQRRPDANLLSLRPTVTTKDF